jgi:acetamidase/formamidase
MGVMGMPPSDGGKHSTIPPRRTGGNLDCKELIAGTSLYLPIEVAGGLFSIGDGHATQGDGEVSGTAIECPMSRVAVTLFLREESIRLPRARTRDAWLTFGFDEDLDKAAFAAVNEMVSILAERHSVSRATALALASVAVDLRVTQYVNQVKGAHACLRDNAIRS